MESLPDDTKNKLPTPALMLSSNNSVVVEEHYSLNCVLIFCISEFAFTLRTFLTNMTFIDNLFVLVNNVSVGQYNEHSVVKKRWMMSDLQIVWTQC